MQAAHLTLRTGRWRGLALCLAVLCAPLTSHAGVFDDVRVWRLGRGATVDLHDGSSTPGAQREQQEERDSHGVSFTSRRPWRSSSPTYSSLPAPMAVKTRVQRRAPFSSSGVAAPTVTVCTPEPASVSGTAVYA